MEPVEVLTAVFPCQDISSAARRVGIEKAPAVDGVFTSWPPSANYDPEHGWLSW